MARLEEIHSFLDCSFGDQQVNVDRILLPHPVRAGDPLLERFALRASDVQAYWPVGHLDNDDFRKATMNVVIGNVDGKRITN